MPLTALASSARFETEAGFSLPGARDPVLMFDLSGGTDQIGSDRIGNMTFKQVRTGSGLFMRHQVHFKTAHQGLKSDMNQISAGASVVEADGSDAPWNFESHISEK